MQYEQQRFPAVVVIVVQEKFFLLLFENAFYFNFFGHVGHLNGEYPILHRNFRYNKICKNFNSFYIQKNSE